MHGKIITNNSPPISMKGFLLVVLVTLGFVSCKKNSTPNAEVGIYKAYQQGFSDISTITKSSVVICNEIVTYKDMDEESGLLLSSLGGKNMGRPVSYFYGYKFEGEEGNLSSIRFVDIVAPEKPIYISTLQIENNGIATLSKTNDYLGFEPIEYRIRRSENRIFLALAKKGPIIRFTVKPFSEWDESVILKVGDKDYEKYSTIQGGILDNGTIVLYLYETAVGIDTYYIDIPLIQRELQEGAELKFVKKAIYLKKQ